MAEKQNNNYQFAIEENLRRAMLKKIMREVSGPNDTSSLYRCLPYLADLTFSDGVAVGHAQDNGTLQLIQQTSGRDGQEITAHPEGQYSEIWKICYEGTKMFLEGHLAEKETVRLGLKIPGGGSIVAEPIRAESLPHRAILCWRSYSGGREYSKFPYEVWDLPLLEIAVLSIRYISDVKKAHLDGVQDAIGTAMSLMSPQFVSLQSVVRDLPDDIRDRLDPKIAKLHSTFLRVEKILINFSKGETES